jgi:hypothetical protein
MALTIGGVVFCKEPEVATVRMGPGPISTGRIAWRAGYRAGKSKRV